MSDIRKYFLKLFIASLVLVLIRRVWGFAPELRFVFAGIAGVFLLLMIIPWPGMPLFWLWNRYKEKTLQSMRFFQGLGLLLLVVYGYQMRNVWVTDWLDVRQIWALAGSISLIAGLVPPLAELLFKGWMALAHVIQAVVSRILLTVIFLLTVFPLSLLAKLVGKRFLVRHPDPALSSYWIDRPPAVEKERYHKHF